MTTNIRFEIHTVMTTAKAHEICDKLYDYLEDTLGCDCAIVIMDADTDKEVVA
jgi:hypothetical protein